MRKVFTEKDIKGIADMVIKHAMKHRNKTGATVVALSGELGAGKTTLTAAIGKQLGIKQKLASPTFILLKSHKIKNTNWKALHHIDAYRLTKPAEVNHINWEELTADPDNLIFLEWPEQIGEFLPKKAIRMTLKHKDKNTREITLK